ncbi:MAG: hypothetical protein ACREQ9_23855, partial [Candidatus Binatia bacterium]
LPGYGFARASKRDREEWGRAVEGYLLGRRNLRALLMLVDVRRDPGEDERLLEELASARSAAVIRVATKVDKLGRADRDRRLRALERWQGRAWIPFSAHSGEGREEVLREVMRVAAGAGGA